LIARVATNESAVNNINGKTAAYWQVTADAGNQRAQLTVKADAYGGAGVDIVGDVQIKGQTGSGRTVISGSGVRVYDANGTLRVLLGLT
jgi:carbohydrate-binding DOMON domain-containing protein